MEIIIDLIKENILIPLIITLMVILIQCKRNLNIGISIWINVVKLFLFSLLSIAFFKEMQIERNVSLVNVFTFIISAFEVTIALYNVLIFPLIENYEKSKQKEKQKQSKDNTMEEKLDTYIKEEHIFIKNKYEIFNKLGISKCSNCGNSFSKENFKRFKIGKIYPDNKDEIKYLLECSKCKKCELYSHVGNK